MLKLKVSQKPYGYLEAHNGYYLLCDSGRFLIYTEENYFTVGSKIYTVTDFQNLEDNESVKNLLELPKKAEEENLLVASYISSWKKGTKYLLLPIGETSLKFDNLCFVESEFKRYFERDLKTLIEWFIAIIPEAENPSITHTYGVGIESPTDKILFFGGAEEDWELVNFIKDCL